MKNYTIRIKTAQFNDPFVVNYEAEKNQVDIVAKDGMFLGSYINGRKMTNVVFNNAAVKIEVEL